MNGGGFKGLAAELVATPGAVAGTLPTAPRGLRAEGSLYQHGVSELGQVKLSWQAPADLGNTLLIRYEYRYAADGGSLSAAAWTHSGDVAVAVEGQVERTQTVRNLALDTAYRFEVRAVTQAGAGASAVVPGATPASGRLQLSVFTRGSAVEGESLTIGVRRSAIPDPDPAVLVVVVEVYDSAFSRPTAKAVDIPVGALVATIGFPVPFDGKRGVLRELAVTLSPGMWTLDRDSDEGPPHDYGVGKPARVAVTVENRDPLVSVADATVREGVGAELLFDVSLDRALAEVVTVDYATSDGTATAGSDYTATSGRLTFATGETENTVRVPVLNDAHDEGIETLTLTLSNARGAALGNAEATGRIVNSGPIPAAWTARFGRTVADQVLEAVAGRMTAPQTVATEISLAGHQVDFSNSHSSHGVNDNLFGSLEERQEREAEKKSRAITGREMLTGSSFLLSDRSAEGSFGALWGRGVVTSFDGREGDLDLDGEVVSGLVGADWTEGRTTMGLVMAHSRGEGAYQGPSGHGENGKSGKIEATLTGFYPWARHALNDRLSVWGVAGYGAGTLTLTPAGQAPMETEMDLAMAAVGGHRVVREAPAFGGLELAVLSDALVVRTTTDRVNGDSGAGGGSGNLAASAAEVTRLRLGLEATWRGSGGGSLEPSFVPVFGIEVRHDGGDAETGVRLGVGGGIHLDGPGARDSCGLPRPGPVEPRGRVVPGASLCCRQPQLGSGPGHRPRMVARPRPNPGVFGDGWIGHAAEPRGHAGVRGEWFEWF